jgi:hypothetical protein
MVSRWDHAPRPAGWVSRVAGLTNQCSEWLAILTTWRDISEAVAQQGRLRQYSARERLPRVLGSGLRSESPRLAQAEDVEGVLPAPSGPAVRAARAGQPRAGGGLVAACGCCCRASGSRRRCVRANRLECPRRPSCWDHVGRARRSRLPAGYHPRLPDAGPPRRGERQ